MSFLETLVMNFVVKILPKYINKEIFEKYENEGKEALLVWLQEKVDSTETEFDDKVFEVFKDALS